MEKKDGFFTKFHREGFTWKDSIVSSFLVFFLLFLLGSIIFGLPNSGAVYDFSIFRLDQEAAKDSLFYNVMFGVEASLTAVIIFAVPCAVILYMMKKKPRTSLDVWNNQEG